MQTKMPCAVTIDPGVRNGLKKLKKAAVSVYGNGKKIQYQDVSDKYHYTDSFGRILQEAQAEDKEIGRVIALLTENDIPEDGVKTAVIILEALTEKTLMQGCAESVFDEIDELIVYAKAYIERVANETEGELLGGTLPYLTLLKPVNKHGRDKHYETAASLLEYALSRPILELAEATGVSAPEVYERVKALAPNQFFSLNQVGIERSISVDSPHVDIWTMGYDPSDGKIKDFRDIKYRENLEQVKTALDFISVSLKKLFSISQYI